MVTFPECCPVCPAETEFFCIDSIGYTVNWSADSIALQNLSGIFGRRHNHIAAVITEYNPSPKQRSAQIRSPEGISEIFHCRMSITDHLCSMAFRSGSRQGRIRKNSIDMDNLRFLCKFTVYFDIFRFQRLFLMQNRLSYTAFFTICSPPV